MSKLVSDLSKKLKLNNKKPKIIYPEGDHFFIQQVAKKISKHIKPILVFKKKIDIPKNFPFKTIAIDSIDLSKYANFLYELRKNKGMTFKQAKIMVKKPNYLCPLLVKLKEVDGEICGINYSTKDTIKPALQIIKPKKNAKFVTSIFLFEKQNEQFLFADCAIMVNPQANELANIAIMACEFAKNVLQIQKPKCAFLSYSTYGSGSGELVDKVVQACKIAKKLDKNNEYDLVGEIQFDAAYNKEI